MRVAELFGPTLQGEGPSAGRLACFLRLSGCNLDCSWCDTPYTWDWLGQNGVPYDRRAESTDVDVEDVAAQLLGFETPLIVITGGEPLTQRREVAALVDLLPDRRIEIETNGTVSPSPPLLANLSVRFNVSPKLSNSGIPADRRYRPEVLRELAASRLARFKFVLARPADVEEVDALVAEVGLDPGLVWLMPEGRNAVTLAIRWPAVAEAAIERRYNASSRLHVLAWGDERAR